MDKYGDIAKRQATLQGTPAPARAIAGEAVANPAAVEGDKIANIQRALLNFHLLLRSQRLYESDHPQRIATLGLAYNSLQSVLERQKLELHVMRDGLASPALDNTLVPDATGEMLALSSTLRQAGIKRITFLPKVRLQEVDILAELVRTTFLASILPSTVPANSTSSP